MKNIFLIFLILCFYSLVLNAQEQLAKLNTKNDHELAKKNFKNTCNRKNDDMNLCLTCHTKNGWKNMKYVHGPIVMNECRPCHISPDNVKSKEMKVSLEKLSCLFCHQSTEIKTVHPDEFKKEKPDCNGCHDPHASDEKYFLR